jgi:hypothetical protein
MRTKTRGAPPESTSASTPAVAVPVASASKPLDDIAAEPGAAPKKTPQPESKPKAKDSEESSCNTATDYLTKGWERTQRGEDVKELVDRFDRGSNVKGAQEAFLATPGIAKGFLAAVKAFRNGGKEPETALAARGRGGRSIGEGLSAVAEALSNGGKERETAARLASPPNTDVTTQMVKGVADKIMANSPSSAAAGKVLTAAVDMMVNTVNPKKGS